MEHGSRRLIHLNATDHPTAAWTLQQLRETIPSDHQYRFIIHDHDSIFSAELGVSLTRLGLKVITTPVHRPQANSLCERLIGTLRRECFWGILQRMTIEGGTAFGETRMSQLQEGIAPFAASALRSKPSLR